MALVLRYPYRARHLCAELFSSISARLTNKSRNRPGKLLVNANARQQKPVTALQDVNPKQAENITETARERAREKERENDKERVKESAEEQVFGLGSRKQSALYDDAASDADILDRVLPVAQCIRLCTWLDPTRFGRGFSVSAFGFQFLVSVSVSALPCSSARLSIHPSIYPSS